MQTNFFHPFTKKEDKDPVAKRLENISQFLLIIVLGLIPVFFIPVAYAPFSYSKVLFVLSGVTVAVIFFSLAILKEGDFKLNLPVSLSAFLLLCFAYIVSAVFSGDIRDAILGDAMGIHTTGFVLLMGLVMTSTLMLHRSKQFIIRLYGLLLGSGLLLSVFYLSRILLGTEFLSFDIFSTLAASPFGSFTSISIFFGLLVLITLLALEDLPLTKMGTVVIVMVAVLSLPMLALVNYTPVWFIVGGVSIVLVIYKLIQKHYNSNNTLNVFTNDSETSLIPIIFPLLVFAISVSFIVGGNDLGSYINDRVGINQTEVSPSFTATFNIAKNVLETKPVLGIGPNKFNDAWRLYKDPSINQTVFWDTNFSSGSGYIPTQVVNIGILGIVLWLFFFAALIYQGFRMFVISRQEDRFWQFIGASSFLASVYLWGITFIYTPNATILLLAAVFSGVFLASYQSTVSGKEVMLSVSKNRAVGLLFVGASVLVIFSSVSVLYGVSKHYGALYSFNKVFANLDEEVTVDKLQEDIAAAYRKSNNDAFAREIAQYRLAQISSLINTSDTSNGQTEEFQTAASRGIEAAQLASDLDPTDSRNWLVLGRLYSLLTLVDVEGAASRAEEAFEKALTYDPYNPYIVLLQAELATRTGDNEKARVLAEEAVSKKRNYTEALLFLSQLDIANNDIEGAISRTESVITIEPENPARYYQLGILEASNDNLPRALAAFERALELNPDYANARYFLALGYAEQGRLVESLSQLKRLEEDNSDNQNLKNLITSIKKGEPVPSIEEVAPVFKTEDNLEGGNDVTASDVEDTTLVSPVGNVPDGEVADQQSDISKNLTSTTTEESQE